MKKFNTVLLTAIATLILVPAQLALAAQQTYEGVISDSMCGNKHMMPGKSDAKCIQECVKAGSKYVLMVGPKMFTLDAKPQTIASLAGKHVKITGELKGSTLSIQSIQETAGH
ncbi:MAG: hypothetical protein P4K83_03170 [Terracidiphilus sp.]|nr:hypothetical protein [Terracidiphilus sp.]